MTPDGYNLYIIQMAVTGAFKVGRSKDVERRLGELQVGCPHRLRVLLVADGLGYLEKSVHRTLYQHQTRYGGGEWFHEEGFGMLPDYLYSRISMEVLEDCDWWMV